MSSGIVDGRFLSNLVLGKGRVNLSFWCCGGDIFVHGAFGVGGVGHQGWGK